MNKSATVQKSAAVPREVPDGEIRIVFYKGKRIEIDFVDIERISPALIQQSFVKVMRDRHVALAALRTEQRQEREADVHEAQDA